MCGMDGSRLTPSMTLAFAPVSTISKQKTKESGNNLSRRGRPGRWICDRHGDRGHRIPNKQGIAQATLEVAGWLGKILPKSAGSIPAFQRPSSGRVELQSGPVAVRRSRKGKASLFPTRPRPTRPRCLRGLTRTETASAASAVVRPPTSRLVHPRFNRPGRRKFSETQSCRPYGSVDSRPAKFDSRDATAHSLRQQGRRDEAGRPIRLGGVVCTARS
jgi:hypothetical protein